MKWPGSIALLVVLGCQTGVPAKPAPAVSGPPVAHASSAEAAPSSVKQVAPVAAVSGQRPLVAPGCKAWPPPGSIYRRARQEYCSRQNGKTWCWKDHTVNRAPELDDVTAMFWGVYSYQLRADGRLTWDPQPQRSEDRAIPPPDAALIAQLPRFVEAANSTLRTADGQIYAFYESIESADEEHEPELVRAVRKVPLPPDVHVSRLINPNVGVTDTGRLYSWRHDGHSDPTWQAIDSNPVERVVDAVWGRNYHCILGATGEVWCKKDPPRSLKENPPLRRLQLGPACALSGQASEHAIILTADATIWWWGNNGLNFAEEPQQIPGHSKVTALLGDAFLLLADGRLETASIEPRLQWVVTIPH